MKAEYLPAFIRDLKTPIIFAHVLHRKKFYRYFP
jgi:hypothetical protein